MERISDWMRGSVRAELFGASPAGVLNAAAAAPFRKLLRERSFSLMWVPP